MYPRSPFSRFAKSIAHATGHPLAFVIAALIIGGWLLAGPLFGYSDNWRQVIDAGPTIAAFLMVFLIQNTQNRDSAAMHLKLDELIRAVDGADSSLLDLEEMTERDLARLRARYQALARRARTDLQEGVHDTGSPMIDVI
jgi:low affinity Fe/Cu permease